MAPQDFNLPFYKKCLSQHNWGWRDTRDPFERHRHSANEDFLLYVATTNGREYLRAFNESKNNLPSSTEKTKPKHNTPMIQLTISIPEADKLADAINNLAETLKGSMLALPVSSISTSGNVESGTTGVVAPATTETEAPKTKRGRPAKVEAPAAPTAPAPEPEAPAPAAPAAEREAAPAEQVLTGLELENKAKEYLGGNDPIRSEMRSRLVQFRNEGLGWNRPIRELEDPAMCYQFNEKLEELKAELDQKEAAAKADDI